MEPTTEYQSSIESIIEKAKVVNTNIGNYEAHFLNANWDYSVKLDNGSLIVPSQLASDNVTMKGNVEDSRIEYVAKSFKSR